MSKNALAIDLEPNVFIFKFFNIFSYFSASESFDSTYQTNVVVTSSGHCTYIPPGKKNLKKKLKKSNKLYPISEGGRG